MPEPLARGEFSGVAWRNGQDLVVAQFARDEEGLRRVLELTSVRAEDGREVRLDLAADPDCPGHDDFRPTRLIDGTLGFVRTCEGDNRILIMRLTDQGAERLLSLDANPSRFDYAISADQGIYSYSSGLCAGVRDFSSVGPEAIAITVGAGDQRFELDDMFEAADWPGGCDATGRANMPTWRPGSNRADLAFVASPESVGVTAGRLDVPWRLYVQTHGDKPREVLAGLIDPGVLAWSPDGAHLALTATVPGQGKGVYLINADGGGLRKVADQRVIDLAWSPDGSQLAVLVPVPGDNVFLHDLSILEIEK